MSMYWTSAALWITWWIYWLISAQFTARTKSSESWPARMTHLTPLGLAFFLIFHDPHDAIVYGIAYRVRWVQAVGIAVTAAGLLFAVWARVHLGKYWSAMITLKDEHKLIRTGPYRFVRHPIYTGVLIMSFATALVESRLAGFVGVLLMFASFWIKLDIEERLMLQQFPERYAAYKQRVKRIIPFVL